MLVIGFAPANLLPGPKNDAALHPAAVPHPPVRLGPEKSNATAGSLTFRTSAIIFTPRPRPFSAPYRPGSICANNARPFTIRASWEVAPPMPLAAPSSSTR
jgi:hypothetical protein